MIPFDYLEPTSLEEACSMLSEHKEEAKILAGGQSLLPLLKTRLIAPKYVINIKGLPGLEYIDAVQDGIKIGALTTHRAVETSPLINNRVPMLAQMEAQVGSVPIRNWGTIGGNISHADPAGDPSTALIALGAKIKATSIRGVREISLDDFFVNYFESVLEHDEILTEIQVPQPMPNTGMVYSKESIRLGDYPIISVAVVVRLERSVVKEARIVLSAVGATPIRAKEAEGMIIGKEISDDVLDKMGNVLEEEIQPTGDVVASEEYKRELAKIISKRAVRQAAGQAE